MATQQTKRESVVQTSINREAGTLTVSVVGCGSIVVNVPELDPVITELATYHGLKQKLIDAAAIGRNPDTGKSATPADKFNAVKEVFERITRAEAPEWNAPRESGDGSASLLARALMRMTGKDRATMDEWLKSKSDVEKKALRANAKVAAIIAEIQAESVDDSIDSDELLAELE